MTFTLPTRNLLALLLLLCTSTLFASLPNFTLTLTPTPQTCLGNGAISFTPVGITPQANMDYAVYLLPNTTTPLTTVTSGSVSGLVAGNYRVIATQSFNGESNTSTADVTVANQVVQLQYTLAQTKVRCGNDGKITVTVTAGTAVSYQIMAGPVTVAPQASNVFNNLPAGLYQVRVFDNCGEATVVSIQVGVAQPLVVIDMAQFDGGHLPSCNTITTSHFFGTLTNYEIFYPLTFQLTVYPPGGAMPVIVTSTVTSGTTADINIPYFTGQYTYNVKVIDACGNQYTRTNNIVNEPLSIKSEPGILGCVDNIFTLEPNNFVGPYTLTFAQAPAGFVPGNFNASHPTFTTDTVQYGQLGNPVPEGTYTVTLTDACGRTAMKTFQVADPDVHPQVSVDVEGCAATGSMNIGFNTRDVVSVIFTQVPPGYPVAPPANVSSFISQGAFFMDNLPLGIYLMTITDSCGQTYNETANIQNPNPIPELAVLQRPGCDLGMGSIRLGNSGVVILTAASVTAGPSAYSATYPVAVSQYILQSGANKGTLFLNSLPAGSYTFSTTDECGLVRVQNVTVEGYAITTNEINIIPYCSAFDLSLQHTSNGNYSQAFWLQKFYPATNTWGHPVTGAVFTEGTMPTQTNSIMLNNNSSVVNYVQSTGDFRIVKIFYTYSNGTANNNRCPEIIKTFTFDGAPVIQNAYSFPCAGSLIEVAVVAVGVAPLTYKITTKNGAPFVINNGTSSVFSGLQAATYNFQVTDNCGNLRNIQYDIQSLDPMEITAAGFCENEASSLSVQQFSFLTYQWYKEGAPGTILSTSSTLNFPSYNSAAQAGTYHVIISSANPQSCMNQNLSIPVAPNPMPNAGTNNTVNLCTSAGLVDLSTYLSQHDAGGTWQDVNSTGALTGSSFNTLGIAQGTYQFIYTVNGVCSLTDTATINIQLHDAPLTPAVSPAILICSGSDIHLNATPVAGATYSWAGPNGFTSSLQNPQITGATAAATGNYQLVVSVNGCPSPAATVPVTVSPVPQAGPDATAIVCNDGSAINLAAQLSQNDAGGLWADLDGTGALSGNTLATGSLAEGIYHFRYTVNAACGASDDAVITIDLRNKPSAPSVAAIAPICEGSPLQLNAASIAGAVYEWTGPSGFTSALQNPLIPAAAVNASGQYNVKVWVNGCASPVASASVVVNAYPVFSLQGDATICAGTQTTLSVAPSNFSIAGAQYEWFRDTQSLGNLTSSYTTDVPGQYRVLVTTNSCAHEEAFNVQEVTIEQNILLDKKCENDRFIVRVLNTGDYAGATYTWNGPDGFSESGPNPYVDITDRTGGTYSLVITSAEGCLADISLVIPYTRCMIPKGVSPNSDTKNDSFDLANLDVRHIQIFNRYGMQVYEKENYVNEWHGQSNRGELPTGTYYYVLTLGDEGRKVTGWVYLLKEI